MSLKIVVDATPIRSQPSGVGIYVLNLIRALYSLQEEENFRLGLSYHPSMKKWLSRDSSLPDVLQHYSPLHRFPLPITLCNLLTKIPNPILARLEPKFGNPDIFNGTDHFVYPCRHSFNVMTIHDLTFIKYPEYTSNIVRKTYRDRIQQCLKWTDLVLTLAQSTKRDIIQHLKVDPDNIAIAPLANRYSHEFIETIAASSHALSYPGDRPYILFVSTLEPRKNLNHLIAAFNHLKHNDKIEHHLILIGQKGWNYDSIFQSIADSPWREQIHHLDYLSDEDVARFYAQADVFVYPSYYEGFGLPVLEAMAFGIPVVTSNTASLPEVAGDAALLIDPQDAIALADALLKAIADSQLRRELIQKGKQRAKLFSWERTARETLKAYRQQH